MNIQNILAIAALGVVGGSIITKKRKRRKKRMLTVARNAGAVAFRRKRVERCAV